MSRRRWAILCHRWKSLVIAMSPEPINRPSCCAFCGTLLPRDTEDYLSAPWHLIVINTHSRKIRDQRGTRLSRRRSSPGGFLSRFHFTVLRASRQALLGTNQGTTRRGTLACAHAHQLHGPSTRLADRTRQVPRPS